MDKPDEDMTKTSGLSNERLKRLMEGQDRLQRQLEQVMRRLLILEASQVHLHRDGMVLSMVTDDSNGGWPEVPVAAQATAATSTTSTTVTVVNLNTLVDEPLVVPLLPVVEEVQIEGAEVLPEIDQTLEQIGLTMASIDQVTVSLEPVPSKIPQIKTVLNDASAAVDKTLGDL